MKERRTARMGPCLQSACMGTMAKASAWSTQSAQQGVGHLVERFTEAPIVVLFPILRKPSMPLPSSLSFLSFQRDPSQSLNCTVYPRALAVEQSAIRQVLSGTYVQLAAAEGKPLGACGVPCSLSAWRRAQRYAGSARRKIVFRLTRSFASNEFVRVSRRRSRQ